MRKTLLLLCVCLFGAVSGAKEWTGVAPEVGKAYYLYHPGQNQFLFMGVGEVYGVTSNVCGATPIYAEAGTPGERNWHFSFVVGGAKYYMYQNDGTASFNPSTPSDFEPKLSGDKYRMMTQRYTNPVRYQMLHAGTSGGQCSFEKYTSGGNDGYEWQFIPVEDVWNAMGFEKVTSVEVLKTNPQNYLYAIRCANVSSLILDANTATNNEKLRYQHIVSPLSSSDYLFEMEAYNSGMVLKSMKNNKYFENRPTSDTRFDGDGPWNYHADLTSKSNNCVITPTYTDDAFVIQTANNDAGAGNYLGLWDPNTGYVAGQNVAGNKPQGNKGSFLIYRKLKKNSDMTSLIANPSFETPTLGNSGTSNELKGWTTNTAAQEHFISNKNASSRNFDGVDGNNLFNTWGSTDANGFYIEQTIANLPVGNYQLTCYVASDNNNTVRVALGSAYKDITTVGGGTGVLATINLFKTSAGDATIRVSSNTWFKTDNFHLTYIDGLQDLTPVSGKMNIEVNALQITRVTAYNDEKTPENYDAAIAAIEAAEASVASYANITAAYNECNIKAAAKMTTDGQAAFNASLAVSKYNNGTWETSQEATAIASINSAYITALKQYPLDNADLTECVTNAAVSEGADWGAVTNWSSTGEGFHLNNHSTEGNTDGSGMTTPFAEAWVSSGSLGDQDITHDEITALKNGYYRVTVLARVYNNINADMGGFKFFANDDETDLRSNATQIRWNADMRGLWKTASVVAEVTDGTLNFGFKVKNASAHWLSFKTTTLTYLGETYERPVTIDYTSAIYNPSFESDDMAAWTYDASGDTGRKENSGNYAMSNGDGSHLFNTWNNNVGYPISQTINNMPSGYYRLSAVMASDNGQSLRLKIGESVIATSTATGKENGIETSGVFNFAGGNMTISAEASDYWYKVDNFRLTYLGDASANLKVNNGKLGTFIAPFAITLPENVKAYSATSSETQVTLTKIAEAGDELAAGTPVIVYGDGADVNTNFYGKSTVATNKTVGALTGILNNSDMTISSGKYVLQTQGGNQAFYKLDGDATGALNRCYVTANVGAEVRLVISYEDDDPMAINAIEATDAKAEGLKDGKYLVKGKIVLVKNGLKFNANGQILK